MCFTFGSMKNKKKKETAETGLQITAQVLLLSLCELYQQDVVPSSTKVDCQMSKSAI